MPEPLLLTKLFIPPAQPNRVLRSRLVERLNEGIQHSSGVTLISAPAGFGKTTLVSEWITGPQHPVPAHRAGQPAGQVCGLPVAWLSLDEDDSDPSRFLTYLIAAVQLVASD